MTDPRQECAKALRRAQRRQREEPSRRKAVDAILAECDDALGTSDVEAIRGDTWSSYYGDAVALYLNAGDTYNTTIVYDIGRDRFFITSWGDWVEGYERRGGKVS